MQQVLNGNTVEGIERLLVRLGSGDDVITNTNVTNNQIYGGNGNNTISLGAGENWVETGTGNDIVTIATSANWSTVTTGAGNDRLTGARGEYNGGEGIDTLVTNFSSLSTQGDSSYNNGLAYRDESNSLSISMSSSLEEVEALLNDMRRQWRDSD